MTLQKVKPTSTSPDFDGDASPTDHSIAVTPGMAPTLAKDKAPRMSPKAWTHPRSRKISIIDRRARRFRDGGSAMRTKQLAAGAAIVGDVGLNLVGLGDECRRIPARRIEPTGSFWADFHHRAGALRAVARHRQRPRDHLVYGYRCRHAPADLSPISVPAALPICRRHPAALRPSRDSPIPPALPRPTLPRQLHQIPVPVIRLGHPRTWVMAAARCGAHARQTHPTCPVRLIGRGPIRTGPTRPTRWSRLLHYRRLASHRHNGRMLRLPSRSNTGARRSPPPSTVACDSGLLVLRKLGPAGRVRMPDAS